MDTAWLFQRTWISGWHMCNFGSHTSGPTSVYNAAEQGTRIRQGGQLLPPLCINLHTELGEEKKRMKGKIGRGYLLAATFQNTEPSSRAIAAVASTLTPM